MGTPASINERVEEQTEAIDVDPFDDMTSETSLSVYGHSSSLGITGNNALRLVRRVLFLVALASHKSWFSCRKWREIVVMHVSFPLLDQFHQSFDPFAWSPVLLCLEPEFPTLE